jgi:hypothetical protein
MQLLEESNKQQAMINAHCHYLMFKQEVIDLEELG